MCDIVLWGSPRALVMLNEAKALPATIEADDPALAEQSLIEEGRRDLKEAGAAGGPYRV